MIPGVHMALTVQHIALGQVLISVPAIKHPAKIGSQTISVGCRSHNQGFKGNSVNYIMLLNKVPLVIRSYYTHPAQPISNVPIL